MARERLDLQKHTLNLRQGDMDELRRLFPAIEPSILVRDLVSACVDNAKAKENRPDLPNNLRTTL